MRRRPWVARRDLRVAARQTRLDELLDPHHHRIRITDGGHTLVAPQKLLDNFSWTMERVDNDLSIAVRLSDVIDPDELTGLVRDLAMGPLLCSHVVNTALRLMLGRYPEELVRTPLPPDFDLREGTTLHFTDQQHDAARAIFNRRCGASDDLPVVELRRDLAHLTGNDQIPVVTALFAIYGLKVSAIQHIITTRQP